MYTLQNAKNRLKAMHLEGCTMYPQYHQMMLDDYDFPFGKLKPENKWVKLAALVPWDVAEK